MSTETDEYPISERVVRQFAPYPTTDEAVTAEVIERYLAVQAFLTLTIDAARLLHEWEGAGLPRTGPLRDAYVYAVKSVSAQFGTVYLLRAAREGNADAIDIQDLAEGVDLPYAGLMDEVADHLTAWLEGYGIDPEAILQAAGIDEQVAAK